MLLNLNLRDVLLRGPRRVHHDNLSLLSCCARRLALDSLLSPAQECTGSVMTDRQSWGWTLLRVAC